MKKLLVFKKIMALIVSIGIMGSLCACSDQTWSVKSGDSTMTMGEYVWFMYESYNEVAKSMGLNEETSKKMAITNVTAKGQKVSDMIKESTAEKCKSFLYIENKFKELGLSLTEDEQKEIAVEVDNAWGQFETLCTKNGISKDSFYAVVGAYPKKAEKVFKALYGKDGKNPVSDADLEKYFKENYIALSIIEKSLYKDDNLSEKLSNDEIDKLKKTYSECESKINSNSISMSDLQKTLGVEEDKFSPQLKKINDLQYGNEINDKIKSLEVNKAYSVATDSSVYLFIKASLDSAVKEIKENEDSRFAILSNMKKSEFEEEIKKVELIFNESGLKSFPPSIFDPTSEQQQQRQS